LLVLLVILLVLLVILLVLFVIFFVLLVIPYSGTRRMMRSSSSAGLPRPSRFEVEK